MELNYILIWGEIKMRKEDLKKVSGAGKLDNFQDKLLKQVKLKLKQGYQKEDIIDFLNSKERDINDLYRDKKEFARQLDCARIILEETRQDFWAK